MCEGSVSRALINCSINCKIYHFVVRLFLFQSKYRGKRKKRWAYNISNYFYQMPQINSQNVWNAQKNLGAYSAPQTPSWHARLALPDSIEHIKSFQTFLIFLVDMPACVKKKKLQTSKALIKNNAAWCNLVTVTVSWKNDLYFTPLRRMVHWF